MNRRKICRIIICLAVAVLCGWTASRIWYAGKEAEPYAVSVIVNDSNNDRWIALKQGLEQAARDYNVKMNIVSTGEFTGVQEELALIKRELGTGLDGIIIQLVASEGVEEELQEMLSEEAVVLLETDITPEHSFACVASDNPGIGKAIAESIAEDLGKDLTGMRIGILSGNQQQLALRQRLDAFKECIGSMGAELCWELDREAAVQLADVIEKLPVDILVTLENTETERAVDHLESLEDEQEKYLLYGEGASEKAVYYLDKGIIGCLVVPNEYHMGYESMENMIRQLQTPSEQGETGQVDHLVVNKENMYDEDNQKILFPIVQ